MKKVYVHIYKKVKKSTAISDTPRMQYLSFPERKHQNKGIHVCLLTLWHPQPHKTCHFPPASDAAPKIIHCKTDSAFFTDA